MARTPRKRKSVGVTMMAFNIQEFLSDMREEMQSSHRDLRQNMDKGFEDVATKATAISNALRDHEAADLQVQNDLRRSIGGLTNFQKNINWFTRACIGAVIVSGIGMAFDLVHNHLAPKEPLPGTSIAQPQASTPAPLGQTPKENRNEENVPRGLGRTGPGPARFRGHP